MPHKLPAPTHSLQHGKALMTEKYWQNRGPLYQIVPDRECIKIPGCLRDGHHINRKSSRTRANGIVALTNFTKPVVTKIYDLAPGGVSFLYANETEITESALKMDILIFDILTNFEYLISQVSGNVKSKRLVTHPKSKAPTWRYSVAFVDLDSAKQNRLKVIFSRIPPINEQIFFPCCLRKSYDY